MSEEKNADRAFYSCDAIRGALSLFVQRGQRPLPRNERGMQMNSDTIRSRAIAYVAQQIRGRSDACAIAEALDNLPAHLAEYVDDLYDNGTEGQWRAFKTAVIKRAST